MFLFKFCVSMQTNTSPPSPPHSHLVGGPGAHRASQCRAIPTVCTCWGCDPSVVSASVPTSPQRSTPRIDRPGPMPCARTDGCLFVRTTPTILLGARCDFYYGGAATDWCQNRQLRRYAPIAHPTPAPAPAPLRPNRLAQFLSLEFCHTDHTHNAPRLWWRCSGAPALCAAQPLRPHL